MKLTARRGDGAAGAGAGASSSGGERGGVGGDASAADAAPVPFVPTGGYVGVQHVQPDGSVPGGHCACEPHFDVAARLRVRDSDLISSVNDWHFAMLNDHPRNQFYQDALRHVIVPGESVVLEIGAGSGILSLICASLGARRVVAIEANEHLVQLAREIISANGFEDRVHVLHAMSTDVTPADLAAAGGTDDDLGPPTVLVSELLGTMLLSESALDYVYDARQRLLAPGAAIIPSRGRQHAQIVESADIGTVSSVREWDGLDLSMFNALRDTTSLCFSKIHGFRFSSIRHQMLCDPVTVLDVDFTADEPRCWPLEKRHPFTATRSGTVHCVVASWDVDANGAERMSTHPDATKANFARDMQWGQGIQMCEDFGDGASSMPRPLTVRKGEPLVLVARYSADGITMQFRVERAR